MLACVSRSPSSRRPSPGDRAPVVVGEAALARGAWEDARRAFQDALAVGDDPAALEGLGLSAWWLDDTDLVFESRERAYRLYRERGDAASAARVAVWLGWDYVAFRGEPAVARGWLGLARQLLASSRSSPEFAWLSIREGILVLLEDGDPEGAGRHARDAIEAAQACGSRDYELLGLAVDGLAQVTAGAGSEGMQQLDAVSAALIAGEMRDRVAIGLAGCYLIAACDRVRDYDRAAQWCERIKAFCAKWGLHSLFAVCRTQYAAVCIWHGHWDEAERELVSAVDELSACRPAMTSESSARLGELRRRQGRLDDAQTLFDSADGHPMATVGQAALALDRGDAATAADLAERYLRRTSPHNRTERVTALDILVRARLAAGRGSEARTAVEELTGIALDAGTDPFRAAASVCRGLVLAAAGDLELARREYEDAVDHFQRGGSPFEAARARLELASVLKQSGRIASAVAETERAIEQLTRIAAQADLARAQRLLASLHRRGPAPATASGLTRRELEVLQLVAKGLSNQRVAEQLFISGHTVHRHVANTFSKLGVSSRSAAVAQAARLGLLQD
jgi:LuxR family transcriptional regulator, maltose regulon positive regulatory protein